MPLLDNRFTLQITRGHRAFLTLQAGLVLGEAQDQAPGYAPQQTKNLLDQRNQQLRQSGQNLEQALAQRDGYHKQLEQTKVELHHGNQQLKQVRQSAASKKSSAVGAREPGSVAGGELKGENIIWIAPKTYYQVVLTLYHIQVYP